MATLREAVNSIQILISSTPDPQAPLEWTQRILYNVEKAREDHHFLLSSSTIKEIRKTYGLDVHTQSDEWIFVSESLSLLLYIKNNHLSLKEEENDLLLSISDQKIIRSLLQFISTLGLYSNLDLSVGMATTKAPPTKRIDLPVHVREERLHKTLFVIMECIKNATLSTVLLPSLLTNTLAGLLQLNYKMNSSLTLSEKVWSQEELMYLVKNIPLSLLVRELLTIQGTARNKRELSWLRQGCGVLLSQLLMERNGVLAVLRGIFEASTGNKTSGEVESVTEVSENWQKCQAIAQILASCPKQAKSVQQYYSLVCPQIVDLFQLPSDGIGKQFLRVGVSSITMMLSKNKELTIKFLIDPLLSPLNELVKEEDSNFTGYQKRLLICINNLNRILSIVEPSSPLLNIIMSYLPLLFDIWKTSRERCLLLSSQIKAVLLSVLKAHDDETQLNFFKYLLHQDTTSDYFKCLRVDLTINESGELVVEKRHDKPLANSETMEAIGTCMNELIKDVNYVTLFLYCLEYMSCVLADECGLKESEEIKKDCFYNKEGNSSDVLLHWEQKFTSRASFTNALILYMMASLCESMDINQSLKDINIERMLKSVVILLKAHSNWSQRKREIIIEKKEEVVLTGGHVTLSIAFGLLSAVMTMKQIDRSLRPILTSLLPYLEIISQGYPGQDELSLLADDLRICIATLGTVWSTRMKEKINDSSSQEKPNERPLIEEINSTTSTTDSSYQKALNDIEDPLLPIKAHGLRQLGQLARNKDKETLDNIDHIFSIFSSHMNHTDSYVYLAAIQGLVELADVRSQLVIPLLCKEYGQFEEKEDKKGNDSGQYKSCQTKTVSLVKRSLEWRVKLGEALVQIARECGDLLPAYSKCLLSAVLFNIKDDDPLIRASALGNLAQICLNLKWSFISIENEVIECLCQVLKHDNHETVKRGAIEVITQLFKGLDTEIDKILHGDSLMRLYRLLKEVDSSPSSDPLTQRHAQIALGQLDTVMRQILFPPNTQNLSKKISILDNMV